MSLREQRREATRQAILDAARDLLEEGGASALTFRGIAERVGVSVGTVVNHAGSKAHVVVHLLIHEIRSAMARRLPVAPRAPFAHQVAEQFRPFFEQYAARPSLARSTIIEVAFAPDDAFAPYLQLTLEFIAELATWLEGTGRLRPHVPAFVAARALFDAYLGVIVMYLREEQPDVETGLAALRGVFDGLVPVLSTAD